MNEDDLRLHFRSLPDDPAAEHRILSALASPPRRHTGLAVAGGVGAVAAVAVAVAVLPQHGAPAPSGAGTQPAAPTTSASSPAPTPSADPQVPLTPQVAVQTLIDLLPPSGTASAPAGVATENSALGDVIYDDGHGRAQIAVSVTWRSTDPKAAVPQGCGAPAPDCTVLGDGTQVGVAQGRQYGTSGTVEWTVTALRPDGVEVQVLEWNSTAAKDRPITRSAPPLAIDAVRAIVLDPNWTSTVAQSTAQADAGLFTPRTLPGSN